MMNREEEQRLAELMERRFNESLKPEEMAELEAALMESGAAREIFLDLSAQHIALQNLEETLVREQMGRTPARKWWLGAAIAAAFVVLGIAVSQFVGAPGTVATLVSSESAAWESALPTTPGSSLAPGDLRLVAGIATLRFASGAEMVLEAPAELTLLTPMRARLGAGSAVMDVPESAIGFVLETPNGSAIDYGTRFSVKVNEGEMRSDFEVLSGEIAVLDPASDSEVRLTDRQAASLSEEAGLELHEDLLPERSLERQRGQIRIGTRGQTVNVILNDEREEYLHPDFLMVKRSTRTSPFDRKALFSFQLPEVDLAEMKSARIRLNLVPSGVGFRAHLPLENRFAVYGLANGTEIDWSPDATWDSAPTPENGILLGSFEIPRSLRSGSFGIETPELLDFLQSEAAGSATFLLIRETEELMGRGLAHAFAGDSHPEASGPILELTLNEAQP